MPCAFARTRVEVFAPSKGYLEALNSTVRDAGDYLGFIRALSLQL
jgi:hypothetical protein